MSSTPFHTYTTPFHTYTTPWKTTFIHHHHTPVYRGVGVWCGGEECAESRHHTSTPHHTYGGKQ